MKIALYGNTCNNFYQLAMLLRDELGLDAHLFIDHNSDTQNRPESDDPSLAGHYPDWIHTGAYLTPTCQLLPMTSQLINELSDFDYVILSRNGPSMAPYLKPQTIFFVTGGDLTLMPFWGRSFRWHKSYIKKFGSLIRAFWQRRGIRFIDKIWAQPFLPFTSALADLRINTYDRELYFPIIIDIPAKDYLSEVDNKIAPIINELNNNWDFIVFHPSRMLIEKTKDSVATGQWKNNLSLLRGFALFLQSSRNAKAALVIIDKGNDAREQEGRDRFMEEAERLGIAGQVVTLNPPSEQELFTRSQLLSLYQLSDVVGVDYGVGWFGSVVVEALALSKPVISYVDEKVMKELYGTHPIISVREPQNISEELARLYLDSDYRQKIGKQGRLWYEQHHSRKGATARYIKTLKSVFLPPPSQ